ncbi:hypothetical protein GWK48_06065 [Metallosphaera tengchongensis]|uniref:Uncharacterized protein n=1 Tax=Metallosphaera tengchongensis TaxID=1532350 RepID=A0A6N0NY05_9CREN|nr:hypothetical protein [Metallosphaera tengchongensis]QKR00001.1 hypothetical protein GWK48_06065 [Metallosphaera tengchongensis]
METDGFGERILDFVESVESDDSYVKVEGDVVRVRRQMLKYSQTRTFFEGLMEEEISQMPCQATKEECERATEKLIEALRAYRRVG